MTSQPFSCFLDTSKVTLIANAGRSQETGSEPMTAIECVDLTKTYGRRVTALRNLTLTIPEGTSFGLLGENGAGKSTYASRCTWPGLELPDPLHTERCSLCPYCD